MSACRAMVVGTGERLLGSPSAHATHRSPVGVPAVPTGG